jgi:uncharacterized protein YdhG (YjbR/CyaY superfamily)
MDESEQILLKKLGLPIKAKAYTIHAPKHYLTAHTTSINLHDLARLNNTTIEWLQVFYEDIANLRREVPLLILKLASSGQLWVSWPKKSSNITSNLSDNIVRAIVLENNLVDNKVASINKTWSGLKFVYRLIDRYLETISPSQKVELERIRGIVHQVVPGAVEEIKYGMPTLTYKGKRLLHFAAHTNHMSIFGSVNAVAKQSNVTISNKGTLQFTEDNPIPESVIRDILIARLDEINNY